MFSPSELLMSRKLQTTVPISKSQHIPNVPNMINMTLVKKKEQQLKQNATMINIMMSELPLLNQGDTVWIPNQDTEAFVGEEVKWNLLS